MSKRASKNVSMVIIASTLSILGGVFFVSAQSNPNLINNFSLETAGTPSTVPLNWLSNKWGSNTAQFSYLNTDGQDGTKSAEVVVSNYVSGDAKWYFDPISVQPNSNYLFTDYYKSDVSTRAVAMSLDSSGNPTYFDVSINITASTNWTQFSAVVKTLPNTQKLTIFHLIDKNGTLKIDNADLSLIPPIPQTTIVPNNSMETVNVGNSDLPQNWAHNGWGSNTRNHEYISTGAQDGSKSVKVTVSNHVDGDASWAFEPQTLINGENYTYKIWYKGNVSPQVVARFERANGTEYFYGMNTPLPATNNWQEYTGTFSVPADSVKTSAYMFVIQNGWLQVDNASIQLTNQPIVLIPNPSLETVMVGNNTLPNNWHHAGWGNSTKTYNYQSTGAQNGTRSVRVTLTNYVDGDASWAFDPQNTYVAGKDYRFKVWYKSNVSPHVVARYERADGTEYFYGMQDPFGASSTTWKEYTSTFHVPTDAVKVSAYMFINENGWLETDNYSISEHQYTGFNRGLVTLVFDDGYEENITTAIPIMDSYGFKTTQCTATQFIEGNSTQVAKIQSLANSGHEICSHTVNHPALPYISNTDVVYELTHAQSFLQSITGQTVSNFASPFGSYNSAVNNTIAQYHTSHRTTDEGYNTADNFDKYRLKVQNMQQGTSLAEFQGWVNKAKNEKLWLILVYHVVSPNPVGEFDTIQSDFNSQMSWLSSNGIVVKKWNDALTEVLDQVNP